MHDYIFVTRVLHCSTGYLNSCLSEQESIGINRQLQEYNLQCDINHFIHGKKSFTEGNSTGVQENEEMHVSLNLVTLTFAV